MNPNDVQAGIQAITQKYGYKPPTPGSAGGAPAAQDWFSATTPKPQQPSYLNRVSNTMAAGADMAGDAFKQGAEDLQQHTSQALDEAGTEGVGGHILTGLKEAGNWAGTIAETAGKVGLGVAKTIASPVSQIDTKDPAQTNGAFDKTLGDRMAEPVEAGAKNVADFTAAHPEVTDWWNKLDPSIQKGISNLVSTVGLTGVGKVADTTVDAAKVVDAVKDTVTDAKNAAASVKDTAEAGLAKVKDTTGKVAGAITSPVQTIKDAVYGPSVALKAANGDKVLADALEITSPTRYKADSIATMENAGKPGGATKSGPFGAYKAQPTEHDLAVANSVKSEVSANSGPLDNIANINGAIERDSGNLATHFANNKVPFSFGDIRDYFDHSMVPSTGLKADPAAFSTYGRVREELVNTVYKFLKSNVKITADIGSQMDMGEIWNARKVVDSQIEKELNATTFESPQYVGVRAAAKDFRDGMNDFLAHNIGNPGEMELVNRMRASMSTLRERGIDIPDNPEGLNTLRQQLGIKTTEEEAAMRSAYFLDSMEKLSNMYEARGNIAESNWRLLDKNFVDRWMKQNPGKAKLAKYLGGAVAGTSAAGLILH